MRPGDIARLLPLRPGDGDTADGTRRRRLLKVRDGRCEGAALADASMYGGVIDDDLAVSVALPADANSTSGQTLFVLCLAEAPDDNGWSSPPQDHDFKPLMNVRVSVSPKPPASPQPPPSPPPSPPPQPAQPPSVRREADVPQSAPSDNLKDWVYVFVAMEILVVCALAWLIISPFRRKSTAMRTVEVDEPEKSERTTTREYSAVMSSSATDLVSPEGMPTESSILLPPNAAAVSLIGISAAVVTRPLGNAAAIGAVGMSRPPENAAAIGASVAAAVIAAAIIASEDDDHDDPDGIWV